MFAGSEELKRKAEEAKETQRAAGRAAAEQREREQMTEGERLVEKYQDTMAYLNDLLAAAGREKGWVNANDLALAQPKDGESFLVLKQYAWDAYQLKDENDLVLPIDAKHAAAVRELLGLTFEQRQALLDAGFYEEPENAGEEWKEEDKLDEKHSGITKQLYGILKNHGGNIHRSADKEGNWYQELAVATTEELKK